MLDGSKRFTELLADLRGGAVHALQNLFFALDFDLFGGDGIAGLAVNGLQLDDVMGAEAGDGTGHHGLDVFALTDFAADFRSNALVGRAAHVLQGLLNLGFRHDVEEGRLFELSGESLLESAVEDGIASGVYKLGE